MTMISGGRYVHALLNVNNTSKDAAKKAEVNYKPKKNEIVFNVEGGNKRLIFELEVNKNNNNQYLIDNNKKFGKGSYPIGTTQIVRQEEIEEIKTDIFKRHTKLKKYITFTEVKIKDRKPNKQNPSPRKQESSRVDKAVSKHSKDSSDGFQLVDPSFDIPDNRSVSVDHKSVPSAGFSDVDREEARRLLIPDNAVSESVESNDETKSKSPSRESNPGLRNLDKGNGIGGHVHGLHERFESQSLDDSLDESLVVHNDPSEIAGEFDGISNEIYRANIEQRHARKSLEKIVNKLDSVILNDEYTDTDRMQKIQKSIFAAEAYYLRGEYENVTEICERKDLEIRWMKLEKNFSTTSAFDILELLNKASSVSDQVRMSLVNDVNRTQRRIGQILGKTGGMKEESETLEFLERLVGDLKALEHMQNNNTNHPGNTEYLEVHRRTVDSLANLSNL